MNMPRFTAEASLYSSRGFYVNMSIDGQWDSLVIQPASLTGRNCIRICGQDSDCIDCCMCLARGGRANQCCM
jgi:hypothetical protein